MKEKQIYKSFKRKSITEKNGWYSKWREEVLEKISIYSKDEIKNLIKEYQIKLDFLNNKKVFSLFEFITVIINSICICITIMITLVISKINASKSFDSIVYHELLNIVGIFLRY